MANRRLPLPPWLIALDFVAVAALAAGGLRLFMPELGLLQGLDERVAWALIATGLVALAVFWVVFVRVLRERRAGRG